VAETRQSKLKRKTFEKELKRLQRRYAAHLPAAGELVIFDRSWYNRAGVERVMGFCTESEYEDVTPPPPELPAPQSDEHYERPPITDHAFVPKVY
jgi:polyphosphate kinase 2 (PPK2 family)